MAGPKLDGVGTIKLVTLHDAQTKLQSLHGLVERMGGEVKGKKPIGPLAMQLKRAVVPLQGLLKGQFSLIADYATQILLVSGRGGPDTLKVKAYRECVAQMRTQIEIAITQTKDKHLVREDEPMRT